MVAITVVYLVYLLAML